MKLPRIVWSREKLPISGVNSGPVGFLSAAVRHKIGEDAQGNPIYDDWKPLAKNVRNLLTNAGKDYLHAQYWTNLVAGGVGVNFIALSESTLTPAVTDTTLGGEITTNGLARDDATTRSHSAGANTTTLSITFTATGSFTDVKASALFNAAAAGTMGHIANFSTGSGTLASGDQLAVTWTMTAS
jgi:hypothetical protein